MKKVINNLATEYTDEGKGQTILMLHGWDNNLHTFDSITKKLKKDYRIIRLDLPGFGKSEIPENDWHLNDYINFVQQFIEKLEISPEILVGHSFGGRIIIKGSAEKVLDAEKNILIASAGIRKADTLKSKTIKAIAKTGKIITSFIPGQEKIREVFYKKIKSDYNDAGEMKETFLNIIEEDLKSYAGQIKTPTLLIWGEADNVTPVTDGQKFKKLIKDSKLKILKDSGHFVHEEKPDEIVNAIKNFNA